MPVPAELEGKKLEGSVWIRRMGNHKGYEWRIRKVTDLGVEIETLNGQKNRAHTGERFQSVRWPIFMNLYTQKGRLEDLIITTDKEGFVQSVAKTPSPYYPPKEIVVEAAIVAPITPKVQMKTCKGPWHYNKGPGTLLPITEFDRNKSGVLYASCRTCLEKHRLGRKYADGGRVKLLNPKDIPVDLMLDIEDDQDLPPPQLAIVPAVVTQPAVGKFHRWRVTIVKEVTVEVEAADYLDAGVAAGEGEIVRVEKI